MENKNNRIEYFLNDFKEFLKKDMEVGQFNGMCLYLNNLAMGVYAKMMISALGRDNVFVIVPFRNNIALNICDVLKVRHKLIDTQSIEWTIEDKIRYSSEFFYNENNDFELDKNEDVFVINRKGKNALDYGVKELIVSVVGNSLNYNSIYEFDYFYSLEEKLNHYNLTFEDMYEYYGLSKYAEK